MLSTRIKFYFILCDPIESILLVIKNQSHIFIFFFLTRVIVKTKSVIGSEKKYRKCHVSKIEFEKIEFKV